MRVYTDFCAKCGKAHEIETPYDDRVRPLLLEQAAKRAACDWNNQDAEVVIVKLLERLDKFEDKL